MATFNCPAERGCTWHINEPHQDWWTTYAGAVAAILTLLAVAALIAWLAYLRNERYNTKMYSQRAAPIQEPAPAAATAERLDETQEWPRGIE